jgi:hypothetical protein
MSNEGGGPTTEEHSLRRLLHRLLTAVRRAFGPAEPHVSGAVHCVNCGWSGVTVVPASSPCYNAELSVLDMLECPECGLFLVCSS